MADREAQVKEVLRLIEEDGLSENGACEKIGISRNTFRSAALKVQAADEYARAMAALAAQQVEKLEQSIDDMRSGVIDAAMARVEIDARKWFASKFLPKVYGDKIDHNIGGQKDNPLTVIERRIVKNEQQSSNS